MWVRERGSQGERKERLGREGWKLEQLKTPQSDRMETIRGV